MKRAFKIGASVIEPGDFSIQFDQNAKISMQPKQIDVMYYLASNYPRVITREELIDNVWQGNVGVGEKALNNTIWHLRQTLLQVSAQEGVIETIRKAGYRLLIEPIWISDTVPVTKLESSFNESLRKRLGAKMVAAGAIFALAAVILFNALFSPDQDAFLPIVENVTKQPGRELYAAPSPDGRFIVYKWLKGDGQDNLYMLDRQQEDAEPTQLTFDDAEKGKSVWSPDGQYVYFSKVTTGVKPACLIMRLNVITHNEKFVANCNRTGRYHYLDVSPDGRLLAYTGYSEAAKKSGIYFIDLVQLGSEPIRFSCAQECDYRDRNMAFSPDGEKILISRRNNNFEEDIYLIDIESKEEERLTYHEEDIVGFTWHPGGEHIVYATQNSDLRHGYVLNVVTKQRRPLNIEGFSFPAYAENSAELFYQERNEKYHIARLDLSETAATSPYPLLFSEFSHRYPDYSAKIDRIVYSSNESGHYELWSSNGSGGDRQQLTFLQKNLRYPRWSHNGKKVAFLSAVENSSGYQLYVFDTETKKVSVIPTSYEAHSRPTWSYLDDAVISSVLEGDNRDLYQFTLADGEAKRLTFNGGTFGFMVSNDSIVYTTSEGGLWQRHLKASSQATEIIDTSKFKETYSWIIHDNGVYFRQYDRSYRRYMHYDLDLDQFTELIRIPSFQLHNGISLNKKNGQLLFTNNTMPQADIKKLEHPFLPK
jgi:Tol biopolymer transport system component